MIDFSEGGNCGRLQSWSGDVGYSGEDSSIADIQTAVGNLAKGWHK